MGRVVADQTNRGRRAIFTLRMALPAPTARQSIAALARTILRLLWPHPSRLKLATWCGTSMVGCHACDMIGLLLTLETVINQFFTTYYIALQYAITQASLAISSIVNELDPKDPDTGIPWFEILTALSFALAFLGAPTVAVGILDADAAKGVKYIAQAFIISMQQAPGLTKALFPAGTDESKFVQIGDLSTELGGIAGNLSRMIDRANTLLMTDMPTFVTFVQSGKYSGQGSYSIPNETVGLDIALKTYLSSMAMKGNGWWVSPLPGLYRPGDVTDEGTCNFADNNVCVGAADSAWYLSPDTSRLYSLQHSKGYASISPYQLTQDLVNNQWAPLNVLFDGAFNCTAKGKAGSTDIQFTKNGTVDISCISQIPLYFGCGPVCPAPFINGSCPFPDANQIPGLEGICDEG